MDSLGRAMRYFRKNKGLTLKEASHGIMTFAQLSRFENGQTEISIIKFFKLLDRYNLYPQEIKNYIEIENSQNDFVLQYHKYFNEKNIYGLNNMLEVQEKVFEFTQNMKHQHNCILIRQSVNILQGLEVNKKEINIVKNYLLNVDSWYGYEFTLFNLFIDVFPVEYLIAFSSKFVRQYRTTQNNNDRVLLTIINNLAMAIVMSEKFSAGAKIINVLKLISESESSAYYEMNKANFIRGLYYLKIGESQKGMKLVEDAKNIFLTLKQFDTWKRHEAYLEEVVNSIQTP